MKIAIMQPYFLPYLGYFALIKFTEQWVVFDTPQFMRHSWIERNRILKPNDGWQYIGIPLVKHPREIAIKDITIKQDVDWRNKIIAQLEHYKKKGIYYNQVMELVNEILFYKTDSIVRMDVNALSILCKYLDLNFSYKVFSNSDIRINKVNGPDDWALQITMSLGATAYYNLPGGNEFFNKEKFESNNIKLTFLKLIFKEYNQGRNIFEPGLSIIDVMMFNSPEEINNMLNEFEIIH